MLGYKIYFNGERFVIDDKKSPVETVSSDSVVSWNASLDSGQNAVDNLNKRYKSKSEELDNPGDFLIRTCKDCGNYFMFTYAEVIWFGSRNFKLPCRCRYCRKVKKNK